MNVKKERKRERWGRVRREKRRDNGIGNKRKRGKKTDGKTEYENESETEMVGETDIV